MSEPTVKLDIAAGVATITLNRPDAYNALNSSAVQSINTTFGKNWLTPNTILDPRILQISVQLTF